MADRYDRMSLFCFFSIGLFQFLTPAVVISSAIEDILSGTLLSSAVVLIAFSIPDITGKVFSPLIITRISFTSSMALFTIMMAGSTVLIVVFDVNLRIVAVVCLGFSNGFASMTSLKMLAYYDEAEDLAAAYQNGCNVAMFLGSFGYTGEYKTSIMKLL